MSARSRMCPRPACFELFQFGLDPRRRKISRIPAKSGLKVCLYGVHLPFQPNELDLQLARPVVLV